jgi:hypothetical protein
MPKFTVKSHEREPEESEGGAPLQSGAFTVKSHEREPEEPERAGPLQCGTCTGIAEHTPDEYRLEEDSDEKARRPKPLLPLSDE